VRLQMDNQAAVPGDVGRSSDKHAPAMSSHFNFRSLLMILLVGAATFWIATPLFRDSPVFVPSTVFENTNASVRRLANGDVELEISTVIINSGDRPEFLSGSTDSLGLLYLVYDDTFNFQPFTREHRIGNWVSVAANATVPFTEICVIQSKDWQQINAPLRIVALVKENGSEKTSYIQGLIALATLQTAYATDSISSDEP
jgi:hypothetical protein